MTRRTLIPLAAATVLAGCGSGSGTTDKAAAPAPATTAATPTATAPARAAKPSPAGAKLKIVASRYGRIAAGPDGRALYVFGRETGSKSLCYGACATSWPPVLTKGSPVAGKGTKAGLLGTTRRRD